jgi:phosphohistidine phosphatase
MDLLVVRHAIAEDREVFAETGRDDAERPLTDAGRRKFEKGARGLRKLVESLDVLATSALVRATETAEILEAAYDLDPGRAVRLQELAPAAQPASLIEWLRGHRRRPVVAIVGHEPHLSHLVEHLLVGRGAGFVSLKKGGACLLGLGAAPEAGHAELRWLLTAAQLRRIR